jgi:predicted membrane protein
MKFWDFLLTADSGENFPKVLLFMLIFLAAAVLLTFLEHRLRAKWVWIVLNAILLTAASALFLVLGAGLSELLLFLLLFLLIRLGFVYIEGRGKV